MREIWAIFQDAKSGVLPPDELLPAILWHFLCSVSEVLL